MSIPSFSLSVLAVSGSSCVEKLDYLAVEEPLEIRLGYGPANNRQRANVAVTMRTPGHDDDLAIGYLVTEGLLESPEELLSAVAIDANSVRVELRPGVSGNLDRLARRGTISSSCGVCGKTTLDAIELEFDGPLPDGPRVKAEIVCGMPQKLLESQHSFAITGGLHAAGLFSTDGELLSLREDVGRHNAVDKLVGAEFRAGRLPLRDRVLLVSARASFELVQKAAMAGIAIFAAVGAPSSLAVQLAERLNLTLLGFVRDGRFNIYTGRHRVA